MWQYNENKMRDSLGDCLSLKFVSPVKFGPFLTHQPHLLPDTQFISAVSIFTTLIFYDFLT